VRIDYKLEDKFDLGLFLSFLILYGIGLAAIYSATFNNHAAAGNFQKQIYWGLGGIFVFFIVYFLLFIKAITMILQLSIKSKTVNHIL